jgi:hypothetical protein
VTNVFVYRVYDVGAEDVTLTCTPYADQVEQGDSTVCAGETGDGTRVSVLATFNSDGSYVWEQQ